jgi:RHS repeat-associated protein
VISSYAPDGDVLAMADAVMGPWTYSYDDFNRLSSGTAADDGGVDGGLTLSWTYDRGPRRQVFVAGVEDRYGNRWTQTATGTGNASAVQPNLAFYGNNNQVSGWDYDAAGNLLNDNRNTYAYDAEGRIVSLNSTPTYAYDAEGHRVAKLGSGGAAATSYILDLGGNQVTELNASGGWKHSNVWTAGGRLLATYEGPAGTDTVGYHFHLTDWLGTQRMQTTAAGNQEEECYSYPFGDGLTCTGTDATEHHFTSKERDTESGLDYFGARYLSSDLGRFMTPDWAAKPTAVPYAEYGDPQSLNLYAYLQNNPIKGVDPDGHQQGVPAQITCTGTAYVLAGNSGNIGHEGAPGVTVTNGSAAVVPSQWTGAPTMGPTLRSIGAGTTGTVTAPDGKTESFNTITQPVGEAKLGTAQQAQDTIMARAPGAVVIEIVGGKDFGTKASVTLTMPSVNGVGCPAGTKQVSPSPPSPTSPTPSPTTPAPAPTTPAPTPPPTQPPPPNH